MMQTSFPISTTQALTAIQFIFNLGMAYAIYIMQRDKTDKKNGNGNGKNQLDKFQSMLQEANMKAEHENAMRAVAEMNSNVRSLTSTVQGVDRRMDDLTDRVLLLERDRRPRG
jgi:hypothetical protein